MTVNKTSNTKTTGEKKSPEEKKAEKILDTEIQNQEGVVREDPVEAVKDTSEVYPGAVDVGELPPSERENLSAEDRAAYEEALRRRRTPARR